MKNIIITGGKGFIGSNVFRLLVNENVNINYTTKTVNKLIDRLEATEFDLIIYVTDCFSCKMSYAIDSTKFQKKFGCKTTLQIEESIKKTRLWDLKCEARMDSITSRKNMKYNQEMYRDNNV